MTIPATASQVSHAGDGASVDFPIPFVFDTEDDLKVILTDSDGTPTEITTGFSVTGGAGSTGTLTMDTAPAIGEALTILDDPELTQPADYTANDAFPADMHESALDRIERQVKRLHQRVDRALRMRDGDMADGDDLLIPLEAARAGLYLGFDANGNPIALSGTAGADDALRTDLASGVATSDGARLSCWRRNATGSSARSVGAKLDDVFNGTDFGMAADGLTDNSTAFQNAMNSAAGKGTLVIQGGGTYLFNSQVAVPSNLRLEIQAGASLEMTTDDTPLMKGLGVSNVEIYGLGEIVGVQGAADWPNPASNAEGLIYFVNNGSTKCRNIHIHKITVRRAWCPISCIRVQKLWVQGTTCSDFMRYGILASQSSDFHIDHNNVDDSNVTDSVSYGIMATGDTAAGNPQDRCSISFNKIKDIPSWDAIMCHDVRKLSVIGNECENVRSGIDLGHLDATNVVEDLKVIGNTITLTSTDAWSGSAASSSGIAVVGYDASNRVKRAVIAGNTVHNAGNISGATFTGFPAPIVVAQIDDCSLSGNLVTGVSNTPQNLTGILALGTINRLTINGGSVQGTMPSGAVRFSGLTSDVCTITGVAMLQDTASDGAIVISGSTIAAFSQSGNTTNSTLPFSVGTSTITYKGPSSYRVIVNQAVATIATTVSRQDAFTIAGIAAGDSVNVTLPAAWPAGLQCTPPIISTGQVYLQLYNPTGGNLSMAANDFVFDVKLYR